MAHLRRRLALPAFKKKMKQWPVLCLFGPRQCGKSTFLRELAFESGKYSYATLDRAAARKMALENPEYFIQSLSPTPIVIDEAHKAPALFDEIKSCVDEKRVPGNYVLTGSVEFSKKVGILESLTGRTGALYFDSLTLRETSDSKKLSLKDLHLYLDRGGMPGVCFLRDRDMRLEYWEQWIEKVLHQDLKMISGGRLSAELARRILECLALPAESFASAIADQVRADTRRVTHHLEALESLFVIHRVEPQADSTGKTRWYLFDCGLANYLNASLEKRFEIFFFHHLRNRLMIDQGKKLRMTYYRNTKGSGCEFSHGQDLYLLRSSPAPDRIDLMRGEALLKRYPEKTVSFVCLTDLLGYKLKSGLRVESWSTAL